MEDVLDLYAAPFDPTHPVICVDECPVGLISPSRPPIAAAPGHPQRDDYEYIRRGSCSLFAAFQPLAGWRLVTASARRTAHDFATFLRDLLDLHYPAATTIRLVVDNLNTHTPAALYATFPAEEAQRLARRIEWHYTPPHGS